MYSVYVYFILVMTTQNNQALMYHIFLNFTSWLYIFVCACACGSFHHISILCMHVCVTQLYGKHITGNICKLISFQALSSRQTFPFLPPTTPLRKQFSTVAPYGLVNHTLHYCNIGRWGCIKMQRECVCSAVWVELSSRQIRCGYLDLDLHMRFACSALILLPFA